MSLDTAQPKLENWISRAGQSWWWLAIRGVFVVLIGLYGLLDGGDQFLFVLEILAVVSAVDAVVDVIIILRRHPEPDRWSLVGSRLALGVAAVMVVVLPYDVRVTMPLLAAIFFLVAILSVVILRRVKLDKDRRHIWIMGSIHMGLSLLFLGIAGSLGVDQNSILAFSNNINLINLAIITIGLAIVGWSVMRRRKQQVTTRPDHTEIPPS